MLKLCFAQTLDLHKPSPVCFSSALTWRTRLCWLYFLVFSGAHCSLGLLFQALCFKHFFAANSVNFIVVKHMEVCCPTISCDIVRKKVSEPVPSLIDIMAGSYYLTNCRSKKWLHFLTDERCSYKIAKLTCSLINYTVYGCMWLRKMQLYWLACKNQVVSGEPHLVASMSWNVNWAMVAKFRGNIETPDWKQVCSFGKRAPCTNKWNSSRPKTYL
jgi:hypothetical protein